MYVIRSEWGCVETEMGAERWEMEMEVKVKGGVGGRRWRWEGRLGIA